MSEKSNVLVFPEGNNSGIDPATLLAMNNTSGMNKGFTYTNHLLNATLIYIGVSSDKGEFINTIVHEAKHAQSNICQHFKIREDGEEAAELIAYIVQKMWDDFEILLRVNYTE